MEVKEMNWILIVFLVVVALFLLKYKEVRHKAGFFIVLILLLFLVVSFVQIYKSHKIDLNSFDGVVSAGKVYFSWLRHVTGNVVRITGNVIHEDWGLNYTNISIK